MTSALQVGQQLGLGSSEMARLLGVSVKTVQRGLREGSPAATLVGEIKRRLEDPRSARSVRALAILSAQREGLPPLLERLFSAYVTLDLLRP